MTQRYDVMVGRSYTTRDGAQKTSWTRIGTMFPRDQGGFSISFDALPVPQMRDGKIECRAVCFEPREKEEGQRGGSAPQGGSPKEYLQDEVPF